MLRWLYNKVFGNRYDYYHPGERKLYRYWDGKKTITEDPMVLYKKIMDVGPELDVDIRLSMSMSKDAKLGHNQMIDKVRKAFNIEPLDRGGLTEAETAELLFHFMTYTGMIKKNSQLSSTSAMAPSPTSGSSSTEGLATSNSSASGSTAPDSATSEQVPSPSEPPSPSDQSTQATSSS